MPLAQAESPHLVRGIGLFGAASANMLEMIGVGPFITIPILLSKTNGPQAILGWIIGALVALCDGMVWAELGAAMPDTGGPYHYLSEAFGPMSLGRLMSFLFIWETILIAPLTIASGAVGFAQYARFLSHGMTWWQEKAVAVGICVLITALLYRDIRSVGRLSIAMWIVVVGTAFWITFAGIANFNPRLAFDFPPGAFAPSRAFFFGLGGATLIAMYDYGGYYNVCFFAGEVRNPERVIPRSILISIVAVAIFYLAMNITIIGVIPWREAIRSTSIVSEFINRIYGMRAAQAATVLVLWTTFASVFAVLLGYSRVPYAAAVDGRFFGAFARLHPSKNFSKFFGTFHGNHVRSRVLAESGSAHQRSYRYSGIDSVHRAGCGRHAHPQKPARHRAPVPNAALSGNQHHCSAGMGVYIDRQRRILYSCGIRVSYHRRSLLFVARPSRS